MKIKLYSLLPIALGISLLFLANLSHAADAAKPETKKVCVDAQGKDGKPVIDPKTKKPKQNCKEVKVHKKHEGTAVPVKK
jgi:hypothetical protein